MIVGDVLAAGIRTWRNGDRRRVLLAGGSVAMSIVLGRIHPPLVEAGIVATPYRVSFAFLAIVLALSDVLVSNAALAWGYADEM